jgi:hypothetical protein
MVADAARDCIMSSTVIIASKAGRLGNRLIQGAHFMGNSLSKGYRLLNPSLGEYAAHFQGSACDPLCGFPEPWSSADPDFASECRGIAYGSAFLAGITASLGIIPGVTAVDIRRFDESEEGQVDLNGDVFGKLLESQKLILTMGWKFSDYEGIREHRDEIVRYFTPVEPLKKQAESTIRRAREYGEFVIGVHIRQEDYRFWKGGLHYYETESYAQWIRQCMEIFSDRKSAFMICSSNRLEPEVFRGLPVVFGPGTTVGDLHALSLCDRIMGPPSTFSMWSSYFGNTPLCMLMNGQQTLDAENFRLHLGAV